MVAKRDWLRELKEVSAVDPGFAVAGGGGGGLIVAVDERWLSVQRRLGFFHNKESSFLQFEAGMCRGDYEVNNWTASVLTRVTFQQMCIDYDVYTYWEM